MRWPVPGDVDEAALDRLLFSDSVGPGPTRTNGITSTTPTRNVGARACPLQPLWTERFRVASIDDYTSKGGPGKDCGFLSGNSVFSPQSTHPCRLLLHSVLHSVAISVSYRVFPEDSPDVDTRISISSPLAMDTTFLDSVDDW